MEQIKFQGLTFLVAALLSQWMECLKKDELTNSKDVETGD